MSSARTDSSNTSPPWSNGSSSLDKQSPYSNQQAARSKFFQQMRQARERLDEESEKQPLHTNHDPTSDELRLMHSPDPEASSRPTHRAFIEEKNQDRLRKLIQNNGSTLPGTEIANIRNTPPGPKKTPAEIASVHTNTPKSDRNAKRGLFNKLGLGLKLGGSEDRAFPHVDVVPAQHVPPKAAKLLGTQSLPTRDRHKASPRHSEWDEVSEDSGSQSAEESVSQLPNTPSPKKGNAAKKHIPKLERPDGNVQNASAEPARSKSPLRRESRRLPRKSELRYYDDDNPPTPPSKPRPGQNQNAQVTIVEDSTQADDPTPRRRTSLTRPSSVQDSPTPSNARNGFAGYHSAALRDDSPAISSIYGSINEQYSPAFSNSPNPASPAQRHSLPERTSKSTLLAPVKYDPASPRAKLSVSQLPSVGTSPNSLKPFPLRLGSKDHLRKGKEKRQQSPQASGSKPRDVSESTSASVPVFFDSPDVDGSGTGTGTTTTTPHADGQTQSSGNSTNQNDICSGDSDQDITMEILHEYLIETWTQGESIKQMLEHQGEAVEVLQVETKGRCEVLSARVKGLTEGMKREFQNLDEMIEELVDGRKGSREITRGTDDEVVGLRTQVETLNATVKELQKSIATLTSRAQSTPVNSTDTTAKSHSPTKDTTPESTTPSPTKTPTSPTKAPTSPSKTPSTALSTPSTATSTLTSTTDFAPTYHNPQTHPYHTARQTQAQTYPPSLGPERSSPRRLQGGSLQSVSLQGSSLPSRGMTRGFVRFGCATESGMLGRGCSGATNKGGVGVDSSESVHERDAAGGESGGRGRGKPIQRIDTIPLFASSPLRSRNGAITPTTADDTRGGGEVDGGETREDGVSPTTNIASEKEDGISSGKAEIAQGFPVRNDCKHPNFHPRSYSQAQRETQQHTQQQTHQQTRTYLQNVPQSASTDASLRGGTWGRSVAREKFERWTG